MQMQFMDMLQGIVFFSKNKKTLHIAEYKYYQEHIKYWFTFN